MKGFEEQTEPLQPNEKKAVPVVAEILRECQGKKEARTGAQIAEIVYLRITVRLDGPRLRKIITHIRMTGIVEMVAASSVGYFVAVTAEEANDYLYSLRDRIVAIRATLAAFSKDCAERQIFSYKLFED